MQQVTLTGVDRRAARSASTTRTTSSRSGSRTDPNAVGTLSAGTYYYVVTAIMTGHGESLPSAEVHTTLGTNGGVKLAWGDVVDADSYRVYRGTTSQAATATTSTSSSAELLRRRRSTVRTHAAPPTDDASRLCSRPCRSTVNAAPSVVQAALEILPTIGTGNVNSSRARRDGNYSIQFTARARPSRRSPRSSATSSLRSNGINAVMTIDGGSRRRHVQREPDRRPHELADQRLRLGPASDGGDALTVNGTDFPDVFLLRAATADTASPSSR